MRRLCQEFRRADASLCTAATPTLHTRTLGTIRKGGAQFHSRRRPDIGNGLGRFYFMPDLKVLDHHGLTDATVARTPSTRKIANVVIAHDRKAPPEYLKQRGVNLMVFPPASSAAAALNVADYAVNFGPDLWMPFDTVNAQWATDRFAGRDLRARKTFSTSRTCPQPLSCRRTQLRWRADSRTLRARL